MAREDTSRIALFSQLIRARKPERALGFALRSLRDKSVASMLRPVIESDLRNQELAESLFGIIEIVLTTRPHALGPIIRGLYLLASDTLKRTPNLALSSSLAWAQALQWLHGSSDFSVVLRTSTLLVNNFPDDKSLQNLHAFLLLLPSSTAMPEFHTLPEATAFFSRAPYPDADTLFIGYCGHGGAIGMPVNLLHQWIGRLPMHALYLRDPTSNFFRTGIHTLGPDYGSMLDFVRCLKERLGAKHLVTLGSSMGGFPAICAGIELACSRILCFNGIANHKENMIDLPRVASSWSAARHYWVERMDSQLRSATVTPEIRCVFGDSHASDANDAQALQYLPGVKLMPLANCNEHRVSKVLMARGEFEPQLAWLAGMGN